MYSFNQLKLRQNILRKYLSNEGATYKSRFIYAVSANIKRIDEALKVFKDIIKEDVEGYREYLNKHFELAVKHGGKPKTLSSGDKIITDPSTIDQKKFDKDFEKLKEEYKEILDKQEEVFNYNVDKYEEEIADIEWYNIPLSTFPEEITAKEMPQEIIELIDPDK